MKKIIVLSGKGGVGKTTITAIIAKLLSKKHKVGLIDADLHCPNLPIVLGMDKKEQEARNNKLVPIRVNNNLEILSSYFLMDDSALIWRGPLKHKLLLNFKDAEWSNNDYLLIDAPPGTGDEVISAIQLFQPDIAIIVMTPQVLSRIDAQRAIDFAKKMGIKTIYKAINMSDIADYKDEEALITLPIMKELGETPVIDNILNHKEVLLAEEKINRL